jgi:hypothetical protein
LTAAQAAVVGPSVLASAAGGNGNIDRATESTLFFQNLTAAGFLACGACMSVAAPGGVGPAPTVANSPVNVYGGILEIGDIGSNPAAGASSWFDPAVIAVFRLVLATGAAVPSQTLAEIDRKADDGMPGTGVLRAYTVFGSNLDDCVPGLRGANAAVTAITPWGNPGAVNCAGGWLL